MLVILIINRLLCIFAGRGNKVVCQIVTLIMFSLYDFVNGVLKRGGRFLCLELSHVDIHVFKEL